MTQTKTPINVKYGEAQVTENIGKILDGVLSKIVEYEFVRYSESLFKTNVDRSETKTRLIIKIPYQRGEELEQLIEFFGFVGAELVGQKVLYEEKTIEKTTYFDPKGRENDPLYRRGKKEIEKVQTLSPKDAKFPSYISKQSSIFTL